MRVLVTRPSDQSQELCRMIQEQGGIAYSCPMLEIVPTPTPPPNWWQGYDWLVFVSANAVKFALEAGLPTQGAFKIAAIGQATAQALAKSGRNVDCQAPAPYTSETLLAQKALLKVCGQRILIVKGVGGRTELSRVLTERGAKVHSIELYRRQEPSAETVMRFRNLLVQGIDVILVSSGETLHNLRTAAGDEVARLYALPLVVGGSRLAEAARQMGFAQVVEAASPLDQAMVEALMRFVRQ